MTKLYLVRHAEAEGNLYRIAHGQYNSILTDRGLLQVEALQHRFADIPVDAVYSSDLCRTCSTAAAVYVPKGLPLQKRKDLREIHMGPWEQLSWGEIERSAPEQLTNFTRSIHLWRLDGAESSEIVQQRMLAAVRDIAAHNPDKTVAAFSHGMALRLLLGLLEGLTLEEIGQTRHGDNTAVSLLEIEGDDIRVVFRDDNSHVKELSTFAGQTWWKRPNAIEPGLAFDEIDLTAQDWAADAAATLWEAAFDGSFCRETLLMEANQRPTLMASLEGKPVGLIQLNPEKGKTENQGWISLYYMLPEYQRQGYGIQLLGQAVKFYRPLGRDKLCLSLPAKARQAERFFCRFGFAPAGPSGEGKTLYSKDIAYPDGYESL